MHKFRDYIYTLIAVILLVLFDQYTKMLAINNLKNTDGYKLIPEVLHFEYVTNDGAAWGMLSNQQLFFILSTIVILLIVCFIYYAIPKTKKYFPLRATLVLLFSGAVGNFIDRIINGYVHDFIYFVPIDFPVFNVADCYITISAFILVILILFVYKDENDFDFIKLPIRKKDK